MRRPHNTATYVGDQDRRAIGHPHRDRSLRIVADDHVSFRRRPRRSGPAADNGDGRPMYLANQAQLARLEAERPSDSSPLFGAFPEAQVAGGEKMRGDGA